MFDCHVHSSFSGDSSMPAETACEKAEAVGLEGLAFTDHLDYDYPGNSTFMIDFERYSKYMDNLKARFSKSLTVLKGIEVGIQPHVIEESLKVVKEYDFDYVLASIHIINGKDPYAKGYYEGRSKKETYGEYLNEILFMVNNFDDFDNVGHFEYITRYAVYEDRTLRYSDHLDLFDEILKTIISKGKGFEINTGSFRDKPGIETAGYDNMLIKRYRELGGEIISLASDAHSPEYIGYKFGFFRDMLWDAGFKHTVHYEGRKPVFDRL